MECKLSSIPFNDIFKTLSSASRVSLRKSRMSVLCKRNVMYTITLYRRVCLKGAKELNQNVAIEDL